MARLCAQLFQVTMFTHCSGFCLIKTLVQSVRHQTWPSTRIESNRNESNNSLKTSTIFHILFHLMCTQSRYIAVNVILIASSVFEHGVLMQTDLLYSNNLPIHSLERRIIIKCSMRFRFFFSLQIAYLEDMKTLHENFFLNLNVLFSLLILIKIVFHH